MGEIEERPGPFGAFSSVPQPEFGQWEPKMCLPVWARVTGKPWLCPRLSSFPIPLWAEVPAIQNMRMHLLEETTVRTEWTRAPGPVDAYEIQFIPTVRGCKGEAGWAAEEGGRGLTWVQEVTLMRLQVAGVRVCSKSLLTLSQPGTSRCLNLGSGQLGC